MSLADFARQIGVSPATARQWKKRGRIVERGGGFFELLGGPADIVARSVTPESVTGRDNGVTRELAQDSRLCRREDSESSLNPESRLESCAGCNALGDRVTTLERDNADLRQRIASLESGQAKLKNDTVFLYQDSAEYDRRLSAIEPVSSEVFDDGEGPTWGA